MDRRLIARAGAAMPHQPATALWRAWEVEALVRAAGLPRAGRGLDVGSGDGAVAVLLAETIEADWALVGVDPDPDEAELARATGLYKTVHAVPGDAIPEPDESFDFALANSVLEHVPEPDGVLREVARVLRPGAPLVVTVPGSSFHRVLGPPGLLGRLAVGGEEYEAAFDRRLAHLRYWSRDELEAALARAGFAVESVSEYLGRGEARRWAALSNATAGVASRVAGGRSPIEIQRSLRLRGTKRRAPARYVGAAVALAASVAVRDGGGEGACLLAVARKP